MSPIERACNVAIIEKCQRGERYHQTKHSQYNFVHLAQAFLSAWSCID